MNITEKIMQMMDEQDGSIKESRMIFMFERGAYFDGELSYTIVEEDDGYWFYGSSTERFGSKEYRFRLSEEDLDNLKEFVLPAKEWPEDNRAFGVLDGYYWIIFYDYSGLTINTSGYMKFPEGFEATVGSIQLYIEQLCLKYAENEFDIAWERRVAF